jgi:hypothetical protein
MQPAARLKHILGELPVAAELDWALRGRRSAMDGFKLEELKSQLPAWVQAVQASPLRGQPGRKALVFASLHYWISYATLLALALAGTGNEVTLGYLPFSNWKKPVSKFDLRRRLAYARSVFAPAAPVLDVQSFFELSGEDLPAELDSAIDSVSLMDAQYTLQVEDVDRASDLYQLRLQRNRAVAAAALAWFQREKPDVVIVPNGHILEFGAVFHAARYLEIPAVSYEFGEQRGRIWLARNTPVMLQETDAMWASRRSAPFGQAQRTEVQELFATRQAAGLFRHFYRRWQDVPAEGGAQVRSKLGLDGRLVVLLAANVIGDSLTLGRAAFTGDMSTWLRRTLAYFAQRRDLQLIVRVHPGERNLDGPSVADLIKAELPALPEHIHLVAAGDPVNTYDLIEAAQFGLVYTTTVGLEMAMSGLPVVVAGRTHYRGKGFTTDPNSWDEYFSALDHQLANLQSARLNEEQVEQAWHYAYRFFFDYPQPFPWHLLHFAEDLNSYPLSQLFSSQGQTEYKRTFDLLLGESFDWDER